MLHCMTGEEGGCFVVFRGCLTACFVRSYPERIQEGRPAGFAAGFLRGFGTKRLKLANDASLTGRIRRFSGSLKTLDAASPLGCNFADRLVCACWGKTRSLTWRGVDGTEAAFDFAFPDLPPGDSCRFHVRISVVRESPPRKTDSSTARCGTGCGWTWG